MHLEHEFWHRAWEKGKQGWQQQEVNVHLESWWSEFDDDKTAEVFVPLCGKSLDMLWLLEQGHEVSGIELSQAAVESFFREHAIPFEITDIGLFQSYSSYGLKILSGDFFNLTPALLAETKLVFDRAALIALPQSMRAAYAEKMRSILSDQSKIFLITMIYDESRMSGPPFSVDDEEVFRIFGDGFEIKKIHSSSDPSLLGGLAKRGLDALQENVFFLTKSK